MAKKNELKENKGPKVILECDSEPEVVINSGNQSEEKKEKTPDKKKKKIKETEETEESDEVKDTKKLLKSKDPKKRRRRKEILKDRIEAPIDDLIQGLLDSERTFVDNITGRARKGFFSAFYPFPKNIRFASTEKDEVVVLMVRHHWIGLIPRGILAIFTFLLPFILSTTTSTWFDGIFSIVIFNTGMFLFFGMLTFSILIDGFLKWFFEMNVITTTRIVDLDFVSIMTHRMSETTFDLVQDISHSPAGPLASFFDYGDLYVQTAGAKNEFHFDNIPRPRDVQDTIWDLRFLRKKQLAKLSK
jgi:hypothetical protein